MTGQSILRSIRQTERKDLTETSSHLNRVGAYTAEIYYRWSKEKGLDQEEIDRNRELVRVAAMLHDVGKVAISNDILMKPAGLSKEEYETVKYHTTYGAAMFQNPVSELDVMSAEIALNHHQRWDGKGYPGVEANCSGESSRNTPLKGDQPSIFARITALADVYDALMAKRVYKEPWPEEEVLDFIETERNCAFDPEVVDSFLAVYGSIRKIREKYQDPED